MDAFALGMDTLAETNAFQRFPQASTSLSTELFQVFPVLVPERKAVAIGYVVL